jgi:hypothetical protein
MINEGKRQAWSMSEKNRSFSKKLDQGEFLNMAVWPGRSNPQAEVVSIQLRRFDGDWKTLARLALYRTREGAYSELPERTPKQRDGASNESE